MNERFVRLRAQIAGDRRALERRLDEAEAADVSPAGTADAPYHFAWAAHHAYSALESILERTARTLEGGLPEAADWHRELLAGAFLDLAGIRPPILSGELSAPMHDLRGFRHFVRHAYDGALDPRQLAALQARIRGFRGALVADLDRFDVFLGELASGGETSGS